MRNARKSIATSRVRPPRAVVLFLGPARIVASWFETRGYAALLTMRV